MLTTRPKRKANNRNKLAYDVKYEIFDVAGRIISGFDAEKGELLQEIARGFIPKDFVYQEPYMIYKGKNSKSKDNSFDIRRIDLNDPDTIFEFTDFLRLHGDFETAKDIQESKDKAKDIREQLQNFVTPWDKLTSGNKRNYLNTYANVQGDFLGLSPYEKEEYICWLTQMLSEKRIDKDDIIVEDNRIAQIRGECWDVNSRTHFLQNNSVKSSKSYSKQKPQQEDNNIYSKAMAEFSKRQREKVKYLN